jgi:glycosyltransferase involved in cell wall biosynthesis
LASVPELPNNVILKPASPAELRAAYDRARFVVVPLVPSLRDHGVTTLAEAMAMGKAVICTRTHGVMEFLDEGINGISVPPHDPQALRSAIDHLLQHPDEAEQMGIEGRRRAEEIFALDRFAGNVRQVVDDVITGNRTSIPTMAEHLRRMAVHMDAIDPEPGLITAEVPEQASIAR